MNLHRGMLTLLRGNKTKTLGPKSPEPLIGLSEINMNYVREPLNSPHMWTCRSPDTDSQLRLYPSAPGASAHLTRLGLFSFFFDVAAIVKEAKVDSRVFQETSRTYGAG